MEQVQQAQTLLLALASFKKDLDDIKKKLDEKTPYILTEEAIEGFQGYLTENTKANTKRGFQHLLGEFGRAFPVRNLAEIPPVLLQEFLATRWNKKKATLAHSFTLLKWFYSWSIKYCQILGRPAFLNPCDFIGIKGNTLPERPEYVPIEKMREFLGTAKKETHWLIFAILMTAGLRVSELIEDSRGGKDGLLKKDINGRVLTIRNPKSGRESEIAVIPKEVADRLEKYTSELRPEDKVFDLSYSTVRDIVATHSKWVGLKLTPHDLRKWIASFWQRAGEYVMTNFVLRHSATKAEGAVIITSLGARYVAPLTPEEVMEKQDRLLKEVL